MSCLSATHTALVIYLNCYIQIIPSRMISWSRKTFSITVPLIFFNNGFFNMLSGPGSSISSGDLPSISFTVLSKRFADIVDTAPYLRHASVYSKQAVYRLHGSAHGILGREDGVTWSFGKLSQEGEVHTAIRDNIRAVAFAFSA